MKLVKYIAIAAIVFASSIASAQIKIGHINSQELLMAMPETDSAQKKLASIQEQHELLIEEMTVEFNRKLEEYQNLPETVTPLIRASKEAELQDLQERVAKFNQTAQQDLQQQQGQLMQPIQAKAIAAVNEVAAELGFTYVFDSGVGVIVYTDPNAEDILPLVKKKLGLE